jgi:hypothetical protein
MTIGEQTLSTRDEILNLHARLAVAWERDDAGAEIYTWEDDGGSWQDDAYPEGEES